MKTIQTQDQIYKEIFTPKGDDFDSLIAETVTKKEVKQKYLSDALVCANEILNDTPGFLEQRTAEECAKNRLFVVCQGLYAFGGRNQDMKDTLRKYPAYFAAGKISLEDVKLTMRGMVIEIENCLKQP